MGLAAIVNRALDNYEAFKDEVKSSYSKGGTWRLVTDAGNKVLTPRNVLRIYNLAIASGVLAAYLNSDDENISIKEYLGDVAVHAAQALIPSDAPAWMKGALAVANLYRIKEISDIAVGKTITTFPSDEINWVDAANHGMNFAALI